VSAFVPSLQGQRDGVLRRREGARRKAGLFNTRLPSKGFQQMRTFAVRVRVATVFLIGRQPVHAVLAQNAMHGRTGDREAVKPLQIIGNLPWG
jgi:hypothetical protein